MDLVEGRLWPAQKAERERLDRIDQWYRWDQPDPELARDDREAKLLLQLSKTPWLWLVVTTLAQMLAVDGWHSGAPKPKPKAEEGEEPPVADVPTPWRIWTRNQLGARQVAIHRASLAYGYAYSTVLPGQVRTADGMRRAAVIRGVSPREMYAAYEDPASDDWPLFALRVIDGPKTTKYLRLLDETSVHYLASENGGRVKYIEERVHDLGVCPVPRYAAAMDLEGRLDGEVEPFISLAARINKTDFDRLLVQHWNSWKVRTATGLDDEVTDEEAQKRLQLLRHRDILTGGEGVTFGALPETQMDGFIKAHDSDVETLAAVSQVSSHNLTGAMMQMSAEALAAAEAKTQRRASERKLGIGKGHDDGLRLGAWIEGDEEAANDYAGHVTWQDMESRSLAQAVDALGKAAQMLGVPVEALWGRIPGVTATDVEEWTRLAAEAAERDPMAVLARRSGDQLNA